MRPWKHFCLALCLLFVIASATAQGPPQQPGLAPYQSYDESNFDTVDLLGGAVQLHIPIVSYPQKGTLPPLSLQLGYSNPSWTATVFQSGGSDYTQWVFNPPSGSGLVMTPSFTGSTFPDGEDVNHNPLYGNTVIDASGASHEMFGVVSAAGVQTSMYETIDGSGIGKLNGFIDRNGIRYLGGCIGYYAQNTCATGTMFMQDPSGNAVVSTSGGLKDSIGRSIPVFSNEYLYAPIAKCEAQQYPVTGGTTAPITICWQQYTATSDFGGSIRQGTKSYVAISSVTLQNGASWKLTYDSLGFLQTVTTPTGAVMTYVYYPDTDTQYPMGENAGIRYLQSRTLNVNGATFQWQYAYSLLGSEANITAYQTVVTDPMGNTVTHLFNTNGTEAKTVYNQGPAQSPLKTVQYTRLYAAPGYTGTFPKLTTTSYPNGQSTTTCVIYDNNTNTSCTGTDATSSSGLKVYDPNDALRGIPGFVPYSAPLVLGSPMYSYVYDYTTGSGNGTLLRETTNAYQWQANDSYRAANLINLVSSTSVSAGGTALSTATTTYDESAYGPAGVYGNATTNVAGGLVTTHAYYNTNGMVTKTADGNGNQTTIAYDATGAYPQTVTQPTINGVAHIDSYIYDANTGLMTSHTDQDKQPTTYGYDNLRRPLSVSYPDGGQDTYSYNDVAPSPTITSTKKINSSTSATTVITADALGRQVRSSVNSDPEGPVYVDTTYDGVGNIQSVSNSYRTKSEATYGVTSFLYDGLGRKTYQCQPDNSSAPSTTCVPQNSYQAWTYVGNVTTQRNEVGNSWARTSDALGRLTNVTEPIGVGVLTSYGYDALGNLKSITQSGVSGETARVRSFSYDSLSRLASSTNSETGTVSYQYAISGAACAGDASLPCIKTDARGITTTYSYDALNRLLSKTYPAGTASSCYQYDQSSLVASGGNLVGRLTNSWTQTGSCPAPTAPPAFQSASILSRKSILAYDAMGRMTSQQQCTKSNCNTSTSYSPAYTYDLAGNVITHSSGIGSGPFALTFTNGYDGAGHLCSVLNGAATLFAIPQYVAGSGCTSANPTLPGYSAAGGLMNATFGTGLQLSRFYDNRLRISSEADTGNATPSQTPGAATITISGTDQTH